MNGLAIRIPTEHAMLDFAARLASNLQDEGAIIFLQGPLGAGKTTFSRGFLRGLGYTGTVKSPTYTLVEPYEIKNKTIFHFDFYRIHHPQELELMGVQDYFSPAAICLIEWPEMGKGLLPPADLSCYIEPCAEGRKMTVEAHTARGNGIISHLVDKR